MLLDVLRFVTFPVDTVGKSCFVVGHVWSSSGSFCSEPVQRAAQYDKWLALKATC